MLSFACKDIGMDCLYTTTANTEKEIMKKIEDHAKKVHGLKKMDPEMERKIKKAIKKK